MKTSSDALIIGGVELHSRLFIGTGKYGSDSLIPAVAEASGAEVITVALRRVDLGNSKDNVLSHIPGTMRLLPNTSGARTADEAVRIARLSRAAGCGDWIKIEVISDTRHLLPDGYETAKATETLAKEGFTVLPYMNPDLYVARDLVNAGAAAVMPLGAPIGTNRGLQTKEMVRILIEEISLPIEVFHHPDGSYSVNIELCYQRVDEGLGPRASSGINVSASFLLPNGREPLQFRIEDLDVLFNTHQG